jgi:Lon protease-like protein
MATNLSGPDQLLEMKASTVSYPIFPLPLFLLPGGMQRLRIFEQKYLSMVANATRTGGFVISLHKKDKPFSSSEWGVHVDIVDFSNGNDGILTIDVLASKIVTLSNFSHNAKGLLFADAEFLHHWSFSPDLIDVDNGAKFNYVESTNHQTDKPTQTNDEQRYDVGDSVTNSLALFLKQIFRDNGELSQLYKTQHFEHVSWVSSRLLEVMPIPINEKEKFVHHLELHQLNQLLSNLCEKNTNK